MTGFAPGLQAPGNENRCRNNVQRTGVYVKTSIAKIDLFFQESTVSDPRACRIGGGRHGSRLIGKTVPGTSAWKRGYFEMPHMDSGSRMVARKSEWS